MFTMNNRAILRKPHPIIENTIHIQSFNVLKRLEINSKDAVEFWPVTVLR